ncbi:MAG TPA: UBP-type zinc finger domain-containing protein [Acidimicrobiia bacterium]|nr:UBP-type zinc finger domain-containing protein [Acidimicrobiia bacterium]
MSAYTTLKFVVQMITGIGIRPCAHAESVEYTESGATECPQCVEAGTAWVHLRMCTQCGQVGCCDSSESMHARRHVEETGHPVTTSIEPGEGWQWCHPHSRIILRKAPST